MNKRWPTKRAAVLAVSLLAGFVSTTRADRLYWSEAGTRIMRSDLEGGRAEVVVETLGSDGIGNVMVDPIGGKIYWASFFEWGELRWANLDGTDVENIRYGWPTGIAVDHAQGKLYFAQTSDCTGCGVIRRTDLDGSDGIDLIAADADGFIADFVTGWMYWSEFYPVARISSADLEGGGYHTVIDRVWASDLALDPHGGKLYWIDGQDRNAIHRANASGFSSRQVFDIVQTWAAEITVDPARGKMYWTEPSAGKVRRANLDGSAAEDVLTDLDEPWSVALELSGDTVQLKMDTESLHWTTPVDGLRYDVVRGNLGALRRSGGNFSLSTAECVLDNGATSLALEDLPGLGDRTWFLVRAVTATGDGTYESLGHGQAAPRDAGIAASGLDCTRTP